MAWTQGRAERGPRETKREKVFAVRGAFCMVFTVFSHGRIKSDENVLDLIIF